MRIPDTRDRMTVPVPKDQPLQHAGYMRLVRLLPGVWEERRDRGLVLAELGRPDLAAQDLADYLAHTPGAGDHAAMTARLLELGLG